MATLAGCDISDYQGDINWPTFKNNVNFVIAKATEGTSIIDEWFGNNRQQARLAGILRGWYHFAHPELNSATDEATFFINVIKGDPLQVGESIYLDYEESWSGDNVTWVLTWMQAVEKALGVKPIFYSYQSMLTSHDWTPVVNNDNGLWVAAPTNDPSNNNFDTGAWPSAMMQQWGNETIPGVTTGVVDADIFFGDANAFKAYGLKGSTPAPTPTPSPTPEPAPTPTPTPDPDQCMPIADVNVIASTLSLPANSTKDAIISAIVQLQKDKQDASTTADNLNKQIPTLETELGQAQGQVKTLTQNLADEKALAQNDQGQNYKDLYNTLYNDYQAKQGAWNAQFGTDVAVFSQLKRNNIYYLPTGTIFSYWIQRSTGQAKQNVPPPLTPADFKYAETVSPPPSTTNGKTTATSK